MKNTQLDPSRQALSLHYGTARLPLAEIVPDSSSMYRISWPDGRLSDLVNLTRAKDAAEATAERGPPARHRKLLQWRITPLVNSSEARWRDWPASEGAPTELEGAAP